MNNDLHIENELHRRGDDRPEDPYRCWWECPIHGVIDDDDVEFDGDGDAICPVSTGETSSRTKLMCGKPLEFFEDDGLDPMMEEATDDWSE